MNGSNITSYLPVTFGSRTFVSSQKNWATFIKEAYAVYMVFKETFFLSL